MIARKLTAQLFCSAKKQQILVRLQNVLSRVAVNTYKSYVT